MFKYDILLVRCAHSRSKMFPKNFPLIVIYVGQITYLSSFVKASSIFHLKVYLFWWEIILTVGIKGHILQIDVF